MQQPSEDLTGLLIEWTRGSRAALDAIIPLVHQELRLLAHRCMRSEGPGHQLQTTALINEAFVRLIDIRRVHYRDRAHFLAICARLMRRILVDSARARRSLKRGRGLYAVALDEAMAVAPANCEDVLAIDEALSALARFDRRKADVVELRYFGGLTIEEIAQALHVSCDSVMRDWRLARVWLLRTLRTGGASAD